MFVIKVQSCKGTLRTKYILNTVTKAYIIYDISMYMHAHFIQPLNVKEVCPKVNEHLKFLCWNVFIY